MEQFKSAVVYGKSVKHQPQRVGLAHELEDEDVGKFHISIHNLPHQFLKPVSQREENHELLSYCNLLCTLFFFFLSFSLLLNLGWNQQAKANIPNPSDHYQAMINIPKPNIRVGNQADGRGTALFRCPCKPRRLSSLPVRKAKVPGFVFNALILDTAEFPLRPQSRVRSMLHDFPFQEGFLLDDRPGQKQGMDGSYAAALTRQIARAEYC